MKVGVGGGVWRFVHCIGPVFIYFYNFVVLLGNLNKCLWKKEDFHCVSVSMDCHRAIVDDGTWWNSQKLWPTAFRLRFPFASFLCEFVFRSWNRLPPFHNVQNVWVSDAICFACCNIYHWILCKGFHILFFCLISWKIYGFWVIVFVFSLVLKFLLKGSPFDARPASSIIQANISAPARPTGQ